DQVYERNAIAGRQILDEAALAPLLAIARPAGAAAHREVLAADGNRPPIDGGETHDVRRRRHADELAVGIAPLAGKPADLLERPGVHQTVNALADRQATLPVMLRDGFGTAELRCLGAAQAQLLDLCLPAADCRGWLGLVVHSDTPPARGLARIPEWPRPAPLRRHPQ